MNDGTRVSSLFALFSFAALVPASTACSASSGPEEAPERATSPAAREVVTPLAAAETGAGSAWAWVQDTGTLGAPYDYSTVGSIASARYETGVYGVTFDGIAYGAPAIAHVVAYGSAAQCKLGLPPFGDATATSLYVTCYSSAGAPADSDFVVFLDERHGTEADFGGAYLSTSGGPSPSVLDTWSSAGGANTVSWDPVRAQYTAVFPGLSFADAAVHVTAYGEEADRCEVVSWGTGLVNVKCFDPNGVAVASGFGVSYMQEALIPRNVGGHAWITGGAVGWGYANALADVECDLTSAFSTAPNGDDLEVSLTNSDYAGDLGQEIVPMVTAYGSDGAYCNVMWWSVSGGTSTVDVRCFNEAGAQVKAASTAFTVSITNRWVPAPC